MGQPETKIIHVDMDAFYASVEQRDFPEYRGRPIAVGGSEGRGVVATASYEARSFGVRSAMPGAQARELCPELVFVPSRMAVYKEVSRELHSIFQRFSSRVEPLALDEAYLDVTEMPEGFQYAAQVGKAIQAAIAAELELSASVGVSHSKFVAKLASDYKKPGGITVVIPDRVLEFIGPMPVRKLWGVGPAMEQRLHRLGLHQIQDLRSRSRLEMERSLGSSGYVLRELAYGRDMRRVAGRRTSKSRGAERTFQTDILELETLHEELGRLAEKLARTLSRSDRPGRTVTLKIRYANFDTHTRSWTSDFPVWGQDELMAIGSALLERTEAGRRPVRLIGLSYTMAVSEKGEAQLELPFSW